MKTYTAIYTYGYDRDDWRDWTFEAPNLDAALKTAYASNPYDGDGYWRIHRVKPTELQ